MGQTLGLNHIMRAACAVAFGASSISAEDASGLVALDTREATKGWEAVGRLDITDAGFCTATLVREDVILTAAHCVYDREGNALSIDRFEFHAGLRDGRALATRQVTRILAHPDYAQSSSEWTQDRMASDIAVLQLNQPIRFAGVDPLPLSPDAYTGDQVTIVSYGGSRAEFPSLQDNCNLLDQANGLLVMDCAAERGTSGAPVVRLSGGRPRVVGVVAAIADMGVDPISLAVPVQAQLHMLTEMLDSIEEIRSEDSSARHNTGAKFIRP